MASILVVMSSSSSSMSTMLGLKPNNSWIEPAESCSDRRFSEISLPDLVILFPDLVEFAWNLATIPLRSRPGTSSRRSRYWLAGSWRRFCAGVRGLLAPGSRRWWWKLNKAGLSKVRQDIFGLIKLANHGLVCLTLDSGPVPSSSPTSESQCIWHLPLRDRIMSAFTAAIPSYKIIHFK